MPDRLELQAGLLLERIESRGEHALYVKKLRCRQLLERGYVRLIQFLDLHSSYVCHTAQMVQLLEHCLGR